MPEHLYWEDVAEGQELPSLVKQPSNRQLVKYAGASGDFYEVHYDKDFSIEIGLPGIIVHGALKNAYLAQMVTDWMGPAGVLKKLSVRYRGADIPGDALTCTGRVTKKYVDGGSYQVDCTLTLENGKGEKTTTGSATVALPSRGH